MYNKIALGKRIKVLREALNHTQVAFARQFGLSANSIVSQWESGEKSPDIEILSQMAEYGRVSLDWLISGTVNIPHVGKDNKFFYTQIPSTLEHPVEVMKKVYPTKEMQSNYIFEPGNLYKTQADINEDFKTLLDQKSAEWEKRFDELSSEIKNVKAANYDLLMANANLIERNLVLEKENKELRVSVPKDITNHALKKHD